LLAIVLVLGAFRENQTIKDGSANIEPLRRVFALALLIRRFAVGVLAMNASVG
jgi:hypothetical protein